MTGPATNISTFAMLSKMHGRKFSIAFAVLAIILAITAGLVTNLIFESGSLVLEKSSDHHHAHYAWWEHASVVLVAVLFFLSYLRKIGILNK